MGGVVVSVEHVMNAPHRVYCGVNVTMLYVSKQLVNVAINLLSLNYQVIPSSKGMKPDVLGCSKAMLLSSHVCV